MSSSDVNPSTDITSIYEVKITNELASSMGSYPNYRNEKLENAINALDKLVDNRFNLTCHIEKLRARKLRLVTIFALTTALISTLSVGLIRIYRLYYFESIQLKVELKQENLSSSEQRQNEYEYLVYKNRYRIFEEVLIVILTLFTIGISYNLLSKFIYDKSLIRLTEKTLEEVESMIEVLSSQINRQK